MTRVPTLALLLIAACTPSDAAEDTSFNATARALDGDTVAADFRLLGVDAFERRQLCQKAGACCECGKAAQDLAARTLHGGDANIRLSSPSSYGRPVAVVTVNGRDLGEVMIGSGLAIPQPQFLKADPDRAARYAAVFADAKRRGAGAFGGEWIEPTQWRRGRRLTCER